jgi:hypothetical protein
MYLCLAVEVMAVSTLFISGCSSKSNLLSIAITPSSQGTLAVGLKQQFKATGTYANNSTADISSQVTWVSSDTNVATISSTGSATGVAVGNTNITATQLGVTSATVRLVVVIATLSSIAVKPTNPDNLEVGSSLQFTAIGSYSNNSTKDITSQVTWISSDTTIATISSAGLASSLAVGSTNITAALSGITSTPAILLVAKLSSIAITPSSTGNLVVGSKQLFTALGTYEDGSIADIRSLVTWTSSDTTIATISSVGLVTGVADGNTNITATMLGITSPPVTLSVVTPTPTPSTTSTSTATTTPSATPKTTP